MDGATKRPLVDHRVLSAGRCASDPFSYSDMNLPIRRTTGRSVGGMSAIVAVEEAGAAPGGRPDAAGEDGSEEPASASAFLEALRVRTGPSMPGSIEVRYQV